MAQGTCSIVENGEICGKPVAARGWCKGHWQRWRRTGDPLGSRRKIDPAPEGMKTCGTCGDAKPLDDFYRHPEGRLGRQAHCKTCVDAKLTARYWADPEKHRTKVRAYLVGNRDAVLARRRAAYREEPERHRAYSRDYARANREKGRVREREYYHRDAKRRADRIARAGAYRARKLGAETEHVDRTKVFRAAAGICGICGEPVDPDDFHVDHIMPLSRGGSHSYANTQPAHPLCNWRKNARLVA